MTDKGYGIIMYGKRRMRTHRVVFEIAKGMIGDGLVVCHHCDNRRCVNPAHLFRGTRAENNADRDMKGRARYPNATKTHCKRGHAFTPENTYHYTWRGRHRRRCQACRAVRGWV